MAFQPINFAFVQPRGNSSLRNIVENLSKGFLAGQMPEKLSRQKEQEELMNKLNQLKLEQEPERFNSEMEGNQLANAFKQFQLQHAPEKLSAEIGSHKLLDNLNRARIEKLLRPAEVKADKFESALQGRQRVVDAYGENSPQAKQYDDYIGKLSSASGTSLSVDPSTGAITFNQGNLGSRGAASEIVDGKLIQKPTTPTLTALQKGGLANQIRKETSKYVTQPYQGTGSNLKLLKDWTLYSVTNDKKIKEEIGNRLVDAAASTKLVPEYVLSQLNAQGSTATVPAIDEQKHAIELGWAELLPKILNNLPPELQERATKKHDSVIEKLSKTRDNFISRGLPIDLEKNGVNEKSSENKKDIFDLSTGKWD